MKQRTTVVECDSPECEETHVGDEIPESWVQMRVGAPKVGKPTPLTFCTWACVSQYAVAEYEKATDPA